ncbi:class F sortase [Streptomyces beihaiensis]|uniref:Class F sortase n=1 Tax=Streptomyces beihaiensis TaxID=2984495 RepID=A0ABT3TZY8_9ACTN|nr:class F sortase [Streptomyces beihaiensis]MCX3062627.1 class F sortase [Streptomyces beihaiensis]
MATDLQVRRPSLAGRFFRGLVLAVTGTVAFAFTVAERPSGPPQPSAAAQHTGRGSAHAASAAAPLPASKPLRVTVPAIHVDAPLTRLALDDDGRLAAPPEDDKNLAGWWAGGPSPGTRGTAIIAGHVDIPTGPAVFYDLGALKPGMKVAVTRADGRTAHFSIDRIDVYSAAHFPDDKVYADTGRPELRLITCGGGFDHARQRYKGNVVVSAHLVG